MYEFISHYKCKHCGNTNCLFKSRRDEYLYRTTCNIEYKSTSTCKLCYLESCRIKNDYQWRVNRDKLLLGQTIYRITHKEEYNKRAREYYQKRKHKSCEQKRNKYVPVVNDGRKRKRIRPAVGKNNPYRYFCFGKANV